MSGSRVRRDGGFFLPQVNEPRSDPRVRPVTPTDLQRLVELCAAHAAFEKVRYNTQGKLEGLRQMLFPPTGSSRLKAWVVEISGELVGYACASQEASTWSAKEYWHLDCLYLEPQARGGGLGRRLLQCLVDEARSTSADEIQWQPPIWNKKAGRFYDRLGAEGKETIRYSWHREAWSAHD